MMNDIPFGNQTWQWEIQGNQEVSEQTVGFNGKHIELN
jgi:hypothetical protein